ncbi:TPT-domain-containing protein [Durotheca rogersii]|uniref:TPT-domain-containing protein n=1 Tax=Durotheca rogersii TaxID=419775 RepID=UPI00221F711D|nr:TPT-domain-containing protein [Durotheca rogersii]KAI5865485.1 TPT-domain-containing protein [Durotheca rogersii]
MMPGLRARRSGLALHPAFYIASWIFFSNITILFNKWLIDDAGFPVILTWWHMTFATMATQVLARTTSLLDGRHKVKMTSRLYVRVIVPIGLLYCGSLVSSTLVYLYLSVPFIQMLKAAAPVVTLLVGWLWGVEHPTLATFGKVLLIVVGVVMASAGEIHFSWPGFFYQVAGILFESLRVIMIQTLVSGEGLNMDPLVSLYYYAPVCAVANSVLALVSGWDSFEWSHVVEVGFGVLLLNALVAFLLNVSSVLLIGKTSGLVLVLTGIFKNILLVVVAVVIWGTPVTPLQMLGYGIALFGLLLYQSGWQDINQSLRAGITWAGGFSRFKLLAQKPLLVVASLLIALLLVYVWSMREQLHASSPHATGPVREADHLSDSWLTWLHANGQLRSGREAGAGR